VRTSILRLLRYEDHDQELRRFAAVVILQQPAESLPAGDIAARFSGVRAWLDEPVAESVVVISLCVIMSAEIRNGVPQHLLAEEKSSDRGIPP
jgi:hypothetical protein